MSFTQDQIQHAVLGFIAFLFSICFHEAAHAWMADRKGDNTAKLMGRLSLNPAVHADIIGTIILPILGLFGAMVFGWAKPVPVNPRNLDNPKNDMFWVAAAGPGSNMLLAFVGAVMMGVAYQFQVQNKLIYIFLNSFIMINLVLCFFNLIPLHPLDGGKILGRFLPAELNYKLENMQTYSMIILMVLFFTGGIRLISIPVHWMRSFLLGIVEVMIP